MIGPEHRRPFAAIVAVHGRAATCVTWQNGNGHAGGITCDFAHAKR